MATQPNRDVNPQPGQYWKPGLRYRESMGGAIAAIHDLVVASGGVPKYYQSNWGGLIAAIRDLQMGGGSSVQVGITPPGYIPGTPGTPGTPAGPNNVPQAVLPTPGTPGAWNTTPQNGDLWFDERQGRLMVWVNGAYYQTNGAESFVHIGLIAPLNVAGIALNQAGRIWFNPSTKETKVYVIDSVTNVGTWEEVSGNANKAYVEPSLLYTDLTLPTIQVVEDTATKQYVLTDANNELAAAKIGDLVIGTTSNGGGIISAIDTAAGTITLGPDKFNSGLQTAESLRLGTPNISVGVINPPTDPIGAKKGDTWYKSDTQSLAYYDGTKWVDIGGGDSTAVTIESNTGKVINADTSYPTTEADGQLWYDSSREVTYVSVNSKWEPISDRKYKTTEIKADFAAANGSYTSVYETTADKHGFFVDYVVLDDATGPTIINGGRVLVYHVGKEVCITNVMAQAIDTTGKETQLGVLFKGTIDVSNNTFKLECVCKTDASLVLTTPPVIQIAVSNWVDPQ